VSKGRRGLVKKTIDTNKKKHTLTKTPSFPSLSSTSRFIHGEGIQTLV
jgi:hypothetical protein